MRVLLTTDTVGGVWTFTRELTAGLLRQRTSRLPSSASAAPSAERRAHGLTQLPRASPDRFHFHRLRRSAGVDARKRARLPAASSSSAALIRSFQPDLLHTNQFCFGALPVAHPKARHRAQRRPELGQGLPPRGLEPSPWLDRISTLVQRVWTRPTQSSRPRTGCSHALAEHFASSAQQRGHPQRPQAPRLRRTAARVCRPSPSAASGTKPRASRCSAESSSPLPLLSPASSSLRPRSSTAGRSECCNSLGALERGVTPDALPRQHHLPRASRLRTLRSRSARSSAVRLRRRRSRSPCFREVWGRRCALLPRRRIARGARYVNSQRSTCSPAAPAERAHRTRAQMYSANA